MLPANCPRMWPLRILRRKWAYLVVRTLREPMSFGQLQRELKFITNHILARELKLLKEEGIIKGGPVYELTSGGKAFYESVEGIVSWAIKHAGAPDCKQQHCGNCINYSVIMASIHGRETKSKAAQ